MKDPEKPDLDEPCSQMPDDAGRDDGARDDGGRDDGPPDDAGRDDESPTTPDGRAATPESPASGSPTSGGSPTSEGSTAKGAAPASTTPTPPARPAGWKRALKWVSTALFTWLVPIRQTHDPDDGRELLIYTSFPKAFYFYLLWAPGFLCLLLYAILPQTAIGWILIISAVVTYLVIAENFELVEFLLWAAIVALLVTLYHFHVIDFAPIKSGVEYLSNIVFKPDAEMIKVVSGGTFTLWCLVYLYSVTWRKRELSSNRRAKLRPPRGKKIIPVVGRIVDNQLVDVLELILGFGAYDVVISETSGRELDRDRNCVGLFFKVNFFSDLVGRIATSGTDPAAVHEAAVAATDAGVSDEP